MAELHTPECQRSTAATLAEMARFDQQYPNVCKSCSGLGWINDPDDSVGMSWNPVPCTDCEDRPVERGGPICALCGRPGDFSERTLEGDSADVRPCIRLTSYTTMQRTCDIFEYRPSLDDCGCRFILESGVDIEPLTVGAVGESAYDYAEDDRAYDEARERAATRR